MIRCNESDRLNVSPLWPEETIGEEKRKFTEIVLHKFELAMQAASWAVIVRHVLVQFLPTTTIHTLESLDSIRSNSAQFNTIHITIQSLYSNTES